MKDIKLLVEFEDGWAVGVEYGGAWVILNASGSRVTTLEREDIIKVLDGMDCEIVPK